MPCLARAVCERRRATCLKDVQSERKPDVLLSFAISLVDQPDQDLVGLGPVNGPVFFTHRYRLPRRRH